MSGGRRYHYFIKEAKVVLELEVLEELGGISVELAVVEMDDVVMMRRALRPGSVGQLPPRGPWPAGCVGSGPLSWGRSRYQPLPCVSAPCGTRSAPTGSWHGVSGYTTRTSVTSWRLRRCCGCLVSRPSGKPATMATGRDTPCRRALSGIVLPRWVSLQRT